MSKTFNTYGAILNALTFTVGSSKREEKKVVQGTYSKRLRPRAGGEGGGAHLGTL